MSTIAISRNALISELKKYNFLEAQEVILFLTIIASSIPDRPACIYIREKISECLESHDNGSDYFKELRLILTKLDHHLLVSSEIYSRL